MKLKLKSAAIGLSPSSLSRSCQDDNPNSSRQKSPLFLEKIRNFLLPILFLVLGNFAQGQTSTIASTNQINIGGLAKGGTSQIISQFSIAQTVSNGTLTQVVNAATGSYTSTDISSVKLYGGSSTDFSSATLLKTLTPSASGSGETLTFSGLSFGLTSGSTYYFWITADVSSSATLGHTLALSAIANTSFTFAAGSKSGSVTAAPSSGSFGIVSATPTFTSGNIIGLVATNNGANNSSAAIVELNTTSTGQTPTVYNVGTSTGSTSVRISGSATSNAYLANTNDGSLFCFPAHISSLSGIGTNANTITTRGVVSYDASGTFSVATTYTGTSGNQVRGASSLNNSTWYIGDQGGFYTNGTSTASPTGNIRGVKSFGGTMYALTASATLAPVGTISAATGGTYTALTGLPNGTTNMQDFALASSGSNGSTYDVLYVLEASSASVGTIYKYALISGTWTAKGTYSTAVGGFGLAAKSNGSSVDIYMTTGTGATATNKINKLTDTAAWNATISISGATTLYTAPAGTTIKGVAFSPTGATVTSALTASGTYNTAGFSYTITGSPTPSSYAATGLTGTGLSLNTSTGVISGTPNAAGTINSDITVTSGGITSAAKTLVITIAKANQSITFGALTNKTFGDANFDLAATSATSATNAITYTSSDTAVATISGSTVTIKGAGTTTITASQASSTNYFAATDVTQTLTVSSASLQNQIITFNALANKVYGDSFSLTATASSNLGVTYVSSNTSVATISGATVTVVGVGTTTITASQAGDSSYNAATNVNQTLTTTGKPLDVTGASVTSKVYDGLAAATITGASLTGVINSDAVTVNTTGTFSDVNVGTGIPVTLALTGAKAGNYILNQPVGLTGAITIASQTITFAATASKTNLDTPYTLGATASSGLTPTYVSSNTAVATVSGTTLTIKGAGVTTITASQSGNGNYNAATDVAQTLTVSVGLAFGNFTGVTVPQYMSSLTGARMPVVFRATVSNLTANTTYRYYAQGATNSTLGGGTVDIGTANSGAGNALLISSNGATYTYPGTPGLTTVGSYETFTTDNSGNYTGWFAFVNTGNARFTAGNTVYPTITIGDNSTGTTLYKRALDLGISVLTFATTAGANNGTFIKSTSSATAKDFTATYDNISGTGRPLSVSLIESIGTAIASVPTAYSTTASTWNAIIPNTLANGVRRIETRSFTNGAVICSATDADGVWSTGSINTVNPTGGSTTAIVIATADAPLNCSSVALDHTGITQTTSSTESINSTDNVISNFRVNTATYATTLNSISFTIGGTFAAGDITNFKLYTSTSASFPGGTALSTVTASAIANGGTVTFSSLNQACATGSRYFWITADFGSTGIDKTVFVPALTNANFTFASNASIASNSITDGGLVTLGTPTPTINLSSNTINAGTINDGTTNNVIYRADVTVATTSAVLNAIKFTTSGTYSATDASNLKLWYSTNATFATGTATVLGTLTSSLNSGDHTFSGLTQNITVGTGYLYLTTDLPCSTTTGNVISVNAIAASDLTFALGSASGSGFATGNQTITASTPSNATAVSATATAISGEVSVAFTLPSGCYDEVMIVASTATNTGVPSGDGSVYTASLTYNSGIAFGNGKVVYKGTVSPQVINGLTNGTPYYFKVFTRNGSLWSAGTTDVTATPVALPALTEVLVPQYLQGIASGTTNSNRVPYAYRATLSNLTANATYRYYNGVVATSEASTSNGAGNNIFPSTSGSFTRSSSPSLATAGGYGTFTTDNNGAYTGWFIVEPTGNATRFIAGTSVSMRILLNDGGSGTTVATRLSTTSAITVISFATTGSNVGSAIRGTSDASAKNFVMLWDNTAGSGRPLSGTFVESDGTANTSGNSFATFYSTAVEGVAGAWGTIIPNAQSNGVRRIQQYKLSDGTATGVTATDADGVWPSGATTTNASSGTTAIVLTTADAPLENIPTASVLSGTATICSGTATNLSVAITGGTSPYTVVYNNGVSNVTLTNYVSGASIAVSPVSTSTYTLVSVTDANSYVGFGNSGTAIVTVNSSVSGTVSGNETICSGSKPTDITLSNNVGTIQWQSSTDNSNFYNVSGETTAVLAGNTIGTLTSTTYYKAVVTNGSCTAASSPTVIITVNPTSNAGTVSANQIISIGGQPNDISLNGSEGTVQWQSSTNNVSFSDISGATSTTLSGATIGALLTNKYFRAVVTSGVCSSATSDVVSVTVASGVSQLTAAQRGATLSALYATITADAVANASVYRFEVTNGATVRTFDSLTNSFNLSQLSAGASYMVTYAIRVQTYINGIWVSYGNSYNVTTPNIPVISLQSTQCGVTLATLATVLTADAVIGASSYRFEVSVSGSVVETYVSTTNSFNLTQLTAGAAYATTYSIRPAAQVNGVWGAYGSPCTVTTGASAPTVTATTSLVSSACGITLTSLYAPLYANIVKSATGYRFEVTNGSVLQTYTSSSNVFYLTQLPQGAGYGTTYSIRVAYLLNGTWYDYGRSCTVTTPALTTTQLVASVCGTTLVSINSPIYANVISGATGYRFEVTNGGITRTYDSSANVFTLTQLTSGAAFNTTYSIRVAVQYAGTWQSFGTSCSVTTPAPKTQLVSSVCGMTLTSLYAPLYANAVPLAEGYRFQVTNGSNSTTYDSATNVFNLTQLATSVDYGTTYTVSVAVLYNGTYQSFGNSCTVKTPSIGTTQLVASACGKSLTSLYAPLYANAVALATGYSFEVSTGGSLVGTYVASSNVFNLMQVSGINYSTTYSVRVAPVYNGSTQAYGTACTVTTPSIVTTQLVASRCGATVTSLYAPLYANGISLASGYRFEVSTGGSILGFYDAATNVFNLKQIAGTAKNTVYTIRVAVLYNGTYQPFGSSCTVTTASNANTRMSDGDLDATVFTVKAYPNPFATSFNLSIESSSDDQVEVKVYDMIGRELEARKATVSEWSTQELGNGYPEGVYNVIVTQGDQVKTLRMIKR